MFNNIPLISKAQFEKLCSELPEPCSRRGRKPLTNRKLLPGILFVLKTGCPWEYLPGSLCNHHYSSCWRRLKFWQSYKLKRLWRELLKALDKNLVLDLSTGQLDTSLVPSPQFRGATGYSGKHRKTGTKLSLIADGNGLPLGLKLIPGNEHDLSCAADTVRQIKVGVKTRVKILNADKGYDSRELRQAMRQRGISANIPLRRFKHRRAKGRKPKYDQAVAKHRPLVERTFAWLKSFRKLKLRTGRTGRMFERFALLGCIVLCLRRILQ